MCITHQPRIMLRRDVRHCRTSQSRFVFRYSCRRRSGTTSTSGLFILGGSTALRNVMTPPSALFAAGLPYHLTTSTHCATVNLPLSCILATCSSVTALHALMDEPPYKVIGLQDDVVAKKLMMLLARCFRVGSSQIVMALRIVSQALYVAA